MRGTALRGFVWSLVFVTGCTAASVGTDDTGTWDTAQPDVAVPDVPDAASDVGSADAAATDTMPRDTAADDGAAPDVFAPDTSVDVTPDVAADTGPTCPGDQFLCGAGCRALNTDPDNCGACTFVCPSGVHATATCTSGTCGITCDATHSDCDHDPGTGCETTTASDVNNCGACGAACPTLANSVAACTAGACTTHCASGFTDCDGLASNGCEANTATSATNCGACGVVCAPGLSCGAGVCVAVATSCNALKSASPSLPDGAYTIDPDGPGGNPPFTVYCDMTTSGGGWTLIAASAGDTNMPRFDSTTSSACIVAAPTAPCFVGAANLAAISYTQIAWSTAAAAVPTTAPIDDLTAGAPTVNATCIDDTEYYRFNQNSASEGMGWTGCVPTEYYMSLAWCNSSLRPLWNLLTCDGLTLAPGPRSSPDYDCSPFGQTHPFGPTDLCSEFANMRHWRR